MITAGIDCGAKNTKTIIMKDGRIIGRAYVATGFDQKKAVKESLERALKAADISRDAINRIGGTGSGKDSIEMIDSKVNDMYRDTSFKTDGCWFITFKYFIYFTLGITLSGMFKQRINKFKRFF